MSGIWGNKLKISIFGESHGNAIGITVDGLPSGFEINMEDILREMSRRAPGKSKLSTTRKEGDIPEILSGVFEGKTTGAPLCAMIRNSDMHSKDYSELKDLMRPGHADYSGKIRYQGYNDYRGGGHFSGRITAPLVFAGAICKQILESKNVYVGTHVKRIGNVEDKDFSKINLTKDLMENLRSEELPVLIKENKEKMKNEILEAKKDGDSIGGIIECGIIGVKAGVGNPFFDSIESTLAHLLFSVPAVKGVEFGKGFEMSKLRGSECNDEYYYDGDEVKTYSNNNGGILGGISNGMPILFKAVIKPTPSISKEQKSINISEKKNGVITVKGRHDPCIIQRAVPVIESVAAIGLLDLML
ncbi:MULTISPECIES: chorismate synthase [unclassified Clostridium]|uniref:chorismate synthase n=1 Tax=unclassified Clostridium TaxID=2614128 RepID=UPI0013F09DAA|nr:MULTISPECIES: chorismate synthase [unclassified Clostridium]NFG60844.1 chorismate synthase [Clostridium botulinum]NFQ08278.1 chorismate synthase [Clostridium botulinum]